MERSKTVPELKPGYLVEANDGRMGAVMPYAGGICVTGTDVWYPITAIYDSRLSPSPGDGCYPKKVYGLAETPKSAGEIEEPRCRPLIWEYSAPKKMTVAEICEVLGYEVEIVKERET